MPRIVRRDEENVYYSKYLNDCIMEAELHEFFSRELVDAGYASCSLCRTIDSICVIIQCAEPEVVMGDNHYRLHKIEYLLAGRFMCDPKNFNIWVDKIIKRGLSAEIMVDNLRAKLEEAMPIRRAAYSIIRTAMRAGAAGCEVIVAGKLRAQRARANKFKEGCLISTGHPKRIFLAEATRHIKMRQGVIGVKVRIYNPNIRGAVMPDKIEIGAFSRQK
ncbi:Ribosomal protein S3 [Giardia duodenalis]|uniref:40S ribosomal protein S3 n=3 Tax=Giardia intestinalis TaxID=5741 RepID=A8B8Z2_GIAIC|nr:Ribosomal protein S3 [Giardia intestinalis]7PWF_D Chain D, Ribosomal protein S3 [Giardia lamblia ATCC 50803]7PWO_D1 Chain D1, Ribosomal protein S3 [Giardia lamblia ATCC 50803]8BR8_SC Chain SC, Ribosomal protein S3 [Giardia lamblia ATCC 50803]8BRM_SC Chain SC, Ribosomal protein S3 [Giardia lamblia ATCC 50803]8BSI_SC Chain SC, Ribosomal protein S3 [Giardia intestinalis]8BSJ_SC Chain SC, Ribosomal protein S3 [Giardia intestinalis]8BTD_SC Chain SC, Ribosomal protein S3 [Giardia lamblia ATCC 5|eukprot:XP_001708724.1 Ribosomal protein S3 [Giardia lamblia ATCC 50803]